MTRQIKNEYIPDRVSPPRVTLKELLEERGMAQAELAKRMGKTPKAVNELLGDTADTAITPETALELERALGLPAQFWLERERAYRESLAREKEREEHAKHVNWLAQIPVLELFRRRLISVKGKNADTVREVLGFFRVASVASWERFWSANQVHYRKSETFESELGHLAAWLRCGEIEAERLQIAESYSPEGFERGLAVIRNLTTKPFPEAQYEMTNQCARAGVALVFVEAFPKARASGAARWIGPNSSRPLIQLSLRYKTDDHFWFTFFHEACHILRHPKRGIYVDDKAGDGSQHEEEANRYARNTLISEQAYTKLRSSLRPSDTQIRAFAKEIGIAPGIVVGRLQFDKCIGYSDRKNSLKRHLKLSGDGTKSIVETT